MPASKTAPRTPAETPAAAGPALPIAAGTIALQAWMDLGNQALRFAWDRLQQDVKTQQAMLACTSLEELRDIQAAFFTAAQEQYAAETGKVLALLGKATAAGLSAAPFRRGYDDVPL